MIKFSIIIFILLIVSCSYDTKQRCDYRWHHQMTMKKLIEKCNYIEYGERWVKKRKELR